MVVGFPLEPVYGPTLRCTGAIGQTEKCVGMLSAARPRGKILRLRNFRRSIPRTGGNEAAKKCGVALPGLNLESFLGFARPVLAIHFVRDRGENVEDSASLGES